MFNIDDIKFGTDGLIPAIACDAFTNEVLMQAYMNKEALEKTIETGGAHYYSRSRKELWHKGETSGNIQKVTSIYSDCDNDCILLKIIQTGAACHTGSYSCFFNNRAQLQYAPNLNAITMEIDAIKNRKAHPVAGSYTNYLFDKGREKICKKIGEEASECIIAAMKSDNVELSNEIADLLYHIFVLMEYQGIDIGYLMQVLEERRSSTRIKNYQSYPNH